jgi:hypothetical protein
LLRAGSVLFASPSASLPGLTWPDPAIRLPKKMDARVKCFVRGYG